MSKSIPFSLEERADAMRIGGVRRREGIGRVDLSLRLLDDGNHRSLSGWIEYSQEAERRGDFRAASAPEVYAIGEALFDHKDVPKYK